MVLEEDEHCDSLQELHSCASSRRFQGFCLHNAMAEAAAAPRGALQSCGAAQGTSAGHGRDMSRALEPRAGSQASGSPMRETPSLVPLSPAAESGDTAQSARRGAARGSA